MARSREGNLRAMPNGNGEITGCQKPAPVQVPMNIALWLATAASTIMTAGALLIRQKRV